MSATSETASIAPHRRELIITSRPTPRWQWLREIWSYREVLWALSKKDFQTRYKRATLGILWAVAVPLLQGIVMAFVFSHVAKVGGGTTFAAYVMSGTFAWSYFAGTLPSATTALVDGSALSEKVWFPRLILVLVPAIANLVGLAVTMALLLIVIPVLGLGFPAHLLYLVPACALLIAFTTALSLLVSALQVYFRDVRFLVTASLLVWLYMTPIVYPQDLLGSWANVVDLNPMTGVVNLFHVAALGRSEANATAILVTIVSTIVILIAGLEGQRRHDRLFVDRL